MKLAYLSIENITDDDRAILYSCIPTERRQKLQQRKSQQAEDQSLVAEVMARVMLQQAISQSDAEGLATGSERINARDFRILRDANGKPYQDTVRGWYFNCSHSNMLVACGVAKQEIGVDIQKEVTNTRAGKKLYSPEEEKEAEESGAEEIAYFTRLWAKKESYLKYTGEGLRRELRTLYVRKMQEQDGIVWLGGRIGDGYHLYACVAREEPLVLYEMNLQELIAAVVASGKEQSGEKDI